ncbi:MAG TPA: alpha/beta hydrolase [Vicinamibacterales bacterium]|nr:alpha/beta hydrolase [Vicinamibacterales bacterium]
MLFKIRGHDQSNPALLLVSGAGLHLSRMAEFFAPWESSFRLVYWDQPTDGGVTLDRLAVDGLAVAEAVRAALGGTAPILLGTSGGSIVGLKMAKARPDLFAAYVGTGQIVRGTDITDSQEGLVLTPAEQAAFAAIPRTGTDQRAQATTMYLQLRDEIAAFDARALGLEYSLPMLFIQGDLDRYTPTSVVADFERDIVAPRKRLAIVEGGGHAALFMREAFANALNAVLGPVGG